MLRNVVLVVVAAVLIVVGVSSLYAQEQSYVLQCSVIGSTSAGSMQGDGYNFNAIAGQPVVGQSRGTGYIVVSGYPNPVQVSLLYLPVVLK